MVATDRDGPVAKKTKNKVVVLAQGCASAPAAARRIGERSALPLGSIILHHPTGRQEPGQQARKHVAAHGVADHHAQLPIRDALAAPQVGLRQALEAETLAQRQAAAS